MSSVVEEVERRQRREGEEEVLMERELLEEMPS